MNIEFLELLPFPDYIKLVGCFIAIGFAVGFVIIVFGMALNALLKILKSG